MQRRCHVKNDNEVKLYMSERRKGIPQRLAAARAGMSERTARKYEHEGKLPSQLKRPHDWQTRVNPFEQDWPGWWSSSRVIPPCKGQPCSRCCANSTQNATVPRRYAPCNGTSPAGKRFMASPKR